MIPKIIHQTSGPFTPPGGRECFESVKRHHKGWDIRHYDNAQMYEIIGADENSIVGVEAADLMRLKILYDEGGWYLDSDMYCLAELPTEIEHGISLEEPGWVPHKILCNWGIGVPPGNPFIKRCYNEGWSRLKDTSVNTIWKTGPGMMSRVYETRDWGFKPIHWDMVGCRKFDKLDRNRAIPKTARALHLFMGCWYKKNYHQGFLGKVRMLEAYEKSFRT